MHCPGISDLDQAPLPSVAKRSMYTCLPLPHCDLWPLCLPVPGFTGTMCQIDIDECASTPCQNGAKCIDRPNGYECRCAEGKHLCACVPDIFWRISGYISSMDLGQEMILSLSSRSDIMRSWSSRQQALTPAHPPPLHPGITGSPRASSCWGWGLHSAFTPTSVHLHRTITERHIAVWHGLKHSDPSKGMQSLDFVHTRYP